jgi:hypothetical protein
MAAVTAPARVGAQHQSLLHFVGEAPWSDENVLAKVREMVLPAIERHRPIKAWIIDDTGFPKQGRHSVGVARTALVGARRVYPRRSDSRPSLRLRSSSCVGRARPACRAVLY